MALAPRHGAPCTSSQDCSGSTRWSATRFLRVVLPVRVLVTATAAPLRAVTTAPVCQRRRAVAPMADQAAGQVCDQGRCVGIAPPAADEQQWRPWSGRSGRCLMADTGDEGCRANSDCAEGARRRALRHSNSVASLMAPVLHDEDALLLKRQQPEVKLHVDQRTLHRHSQCADIALRSGGLQYSRTRVWCRGSSSLVESDHRQRTSTCCTKGKKPTVFLDHLVCDRNLI